MAPLVPSISSVVFVLSCLFRPTIQDTAVISSGQTLVLNGISYFVPPFSSGKVGKVSSTRSSSGFIPITVVEELAAGTKASTVLDDYLAKDDVLTADFLQNVYSASSISIEGHGLSKFKTKRAVSANVSSIPPGPYFLSQSTGELFMAYKLYSDFAGAFTEPLLQSPEGEFSFMSAQISGSASLTVGVPSRLYYTPTAEKPLAGVRVGIKDIYDIKGVKTSCGNRAWYNLYPPANASAVAVQKLIDAGAIIIGKQKTSQFANGEQATADWVDYHSPFNPRGDGYQDTSSSSAGAGASIGSYPWLDLAVGSDTGGSIRGPSEVQGLYGNRPSHGLVSLDGVMPLAPELDTAGFLCRDPSLWVTAQRVLYDISTVYSSYPKTIYTLNFPTNASASSSASVVLNFLSKLQSFLSAKTTALNLNTVWNATKPANTSVSLTTLLNLTYPILISKEQVRLVREPFYSDYAAIHDGRLPFVDPAPLARWAFGDSYPESTLDDAVYNKTLFMNWFNSNVLKPDNATCSDSLMLYYSGYVNERNVYISPPTAPYGFSSGRISPFSEVPDSVFPIGQLSFYSSITQHTEYLPVTVDVLAAKGCDVMIAQLAKDLVQAGILNVTMTGQTITGGEILL